MRTVVTGGAGFIGSAVVDQLVLRGDEVLVLDNLSTGSESNLEVAREIDESRVQLVVADIGESGATELIADYQPDVVFHLAAQADVRFSVVDPVTDAYTNVVGLLRVLEGARVGNAHKVVFASSGGTIYGEIESELLPLTEDIPKRPLSPYGVAKFAGGMYLDVYRSLHGLGGTALALANVYGPRQDPEGEAGVVAIFIKRLLAGQPCTIFGNGEQTRDFVYVNDVARAFISAVNQADGMLINIGTGVETSVNQLYKILASEVGVTDLPKRMPVRSGELLRSSLDPARAHQELGWQASTTLGEGLKATLDWFASNRD